MVHKVVPWVENFWFSQKRFPTDSELLTQFNFGGVKASEVGGATELALLQKLKLTRTFRDAMKVRGIEFNPLDPNGSKEFGLLSPEQVATISVLTNFSDTRPQNLKLNALGVTTEQIRGWMVLPEFSAALTARADEQLNHVYPEAVNALNRRITQGNVPAIKFYFELTGRATTPEAVNIKLAMNRLIEAVQKHVRDPEVLAAIAQDFQSVQAMATSSSVIEN